MTIVVPSETFEQQVTDRLTATARRARIAGFRPGKVPLKEVRRRFGAAVRQEVAGELKVHSQLYQLHLESQEKATAQRVSLLESAKGMVAELKRIVEE